MERHYAQKMSINGIPCDCDGPKHLLDLEAMAEESISIAPDTSIYYRILDWVREVGPKSTEEAPKSCNSDDQYPQMSYQARDLRKDLIGSLDPSTLFPLPFPLKSGKTTGNGIIVVFSEEEERKIRGTGPFLVF